MFAPRMSTPDEADAAWMAARNDGALAPPYTDSRSPTTVWPGPLQPYEERYIPAIYSRWGRQF